MTGWIEITNISKGANPRDNEWKYDTRLAEKNKTKNTYPKY